MTCIVALRTPDAIFMGADSAGVGGYSLAIRSDRKIFRVGPTLIGFTSSFRMGQLLGHRLQVPEQDPRHSIEKYMVTDFIDAVRNCLKTGGFAAIENAVERGGTFLVAYKARIFEIESDYQVGESQGDFAAVGCGSDLALGALHATEGLGIEPTERVTAALKAAERFSAGVRGPFIIETLTP